MPAAATIPILLLLAGLPTSFSADGHMRISPWFHPEHKAAEDALIARALANPVAEFKAWMQQYKHQFTPQEEQRVFTSWKAAVQRMTEHNAQPDITWFMGITERTGMGYATGHKPLNPEQQADDMPKLARRLAQHATGYVPLKNGTQLPGSSDTNTVDLQKNQCPDSLDWRALGLVSSVKQQGLCGSCWTFSITGALESAWAIAQQGFNNYDLSQQALLDCLGEEGACNGANTFTAYATLEAKGWNLPLASDYPYVDWYKEENTPAADVRGRCLQPVTKAGNVSVGNLYAIEKLTDELLQQLVCRQPVTVAVGAYNSILNYRAGVIPPGTDCEGQPTNHAVLVVGYTPDYWIVKNSWGWYYGESGYFRLSRNTTSDKGVCGILDEGAVIPIIKSKDIVPAPTFDPYFMYGQVPAPNTTLTSEASTPPGSEASAGSETSTAMVSEESSAADNGFSFGGSGECNATYVTVAGDTLTSVAKKSGASLEQLVSFLIEIPFDKSSPEYQKASKDPSLFDKEAAVLPLLPDQALLIPCGVLPSVDNSQLECPLNYTVMHNDTVESIILNVLTLLAEEFKAVLPNLTVAELTKILTSDTVSNALSHWNPQLKIADPVADDVIYIPPCRILPKKKQLIPDSKCVLAEYKIQEFDSLYSIANMFSCSIGDLLVLNPGLGNSRFPDIYLDNFADAVIKVYRCAPSSRAWQLTPNSTLADEAGCQGVAVAVSNEDFQEVARYYGTTVEKIKSSILNQPERRAQTFGNAPLWWVPPCKVEKAAFAATETSSVETSSAGAETSSAGFETS